MRDQRWPVDYETVPQEFRSSQREDEMGLSAANASYGNDFMAMGMTRRLDNAQINELEPSFATQLDTNGMQPHAREYLERDVNSMVSGRKFSLASGQIIDHCDGIQFSGTP